MLRKFKIKIDGKEYLVEMEEIGGTPNLAANPAPVQQAAPTQPPMAETIPNPTQTAPVEAEATPVVNPAEVEGEPVVAPMPGTILKIMVEEGEAVKENQPLLVLEAMKMENEIVATHDGVVSGIHVTAGQIVDVSAPLITLNK